MQPGWGLGGGGGVPLCSLQVGLRSWVDRWDAWGPSSKVIAASEAHGGGLFASQSWGPTASELAWLLTCCRCGLPRPPAPAMASFQGEAWEPALQKRVTSSSPGLPLGVPRQVRARLLGAPEEG